MTSTKVFYMKKTTLMAISTALTIIVTVISIAEFSKPTAYADSDNANWELVVSGLVNNQLNLSLAGIQALPKTSVNATLYCVDRPSYVVAQGNWTGVSLSLLLDQAGVSSEAIKVAFHAKDGYTTDLTIETARHPDVILAYLKDGLPLSEGSRLIVPDKWGYKWISQVSNIVLVDYDFKGKWENQGYSDNADITEGGSPASIPQLPRFITAPTPSAYIPSSPNPTTPPTSPTPSPSNLPTSPSPVTYEKTPEIPSTLLVLVPLALAALVALALRKRTELNNH